MYWTCTQYIIPDLIRNQKRKQNTQEIALSQLMFKGYSVDSTGSKKEMAAFDKLWFSLHAAPNNT
jgi:uncharacterized tellurite resistance protein B-like protein